MKFLSHSLDLQHSVRGIVKKQLPTAGSKRQLDVLTFRCSTDIIYSNGRSARHETPLKGGQVFRSILARQSDALIGCNAQLLEVRRLRRRLVMVILIVAIDDVNHWTVAIDNRWAAWMASAYEPWTVAMAAIDDRWIAMAIDDG